MLNADRSETCLNELTQPPAVVAGRQMRKFSAGILHICRRLRMRLFSSDPRDRAGMTETDIELEVYAFGYCLLEPLDKVLISGALGWDRFRDDVLMPWIFDLPVAAVPAMFEELARVQQSLEAAAVEPRSKTDPAAQENAPPNS